MELGLHANATTTPKVRGYIQRSTKPVAELATELGVSETTIRRWRGRTTVIAPVSIEAGPGRFWGGRPVRIIRFGVESQKSFLIIPALCRPLFAREGALRERRSSG
jgi:hypothetical protein